MDFSGTLYSIVAVLCFAVIGGIGLWLAKQHFLDGGIRFLNPRENRTGLVEEVSIGGRRKLLLIRRDNVEHLILTGGPIDLIVETGIAPAPPTGARNGYLPDAPRQWRQPPFAAPQPTPMRAETPEAAFQTAIIPAAAAPELTAIAAEAPALELEAGLAAPIELGDEKAAEKLQ